MGFERFLSQIQDIENNCLLIISREKDANKRREARKKTRTKGARREQKAEARQLDYLVA